MRAVVQRVLSASVRVGAEVTGSIQAGLCVFVGVGQADDEAAAVMLADKVVNLRIFEDESGKMNRSVLESRGALLLVSQFTLFGDVRKGRRPSFAGAMEPVRAKALFEHAVAGCRARGAHVELGRFQAEMRVELVNDGPVTILLDTERAF
jgi:D-aminoacyl-tRNA deacylase